MAERSRPGDSGIVAPVLQTARLRLRGHRLTDLPDCAAMWSDPNVTRMISGTPSTQSQTWLRLLAYVGHWNVLNFGYWVIEERDSGAFVGEAGLADFKRDIAPAMHGVPELGFALATQFHGRGYATEAVGAVVEWGDANLPYDRTVCLINAKNGPSLRIAEKHGYAPFDRTTFNQQEVVLLARTRQRDK